MGCSSLTNVNISPIDPSTTDALECKVEGEGLLPQCAVDGNCRNLNDYLCVGINISEFILSIIGSIAFVMFLFGGFTMIMSFGNPEKFKKGRGIMVLAVVGIVVALSAHLIVDLILDTLGTTADFRAVK